ncbi:hypothetical protein R991_001119 [Salmonella enterica]|nr:hypothetical protein [Salmonella enterica]
MLKGGKGVSPRSIDNYVTGVNERSQHISNLKYEGYRDPMIFIGSDIRFIVKGWCHSPTFFVRENLESRKELS